MRRIHKYKLEQYHWLLSPATWFHKSQRLILSKLPTSSHAILGPAPLTSVASLDNAPVCIRQMRPHARTPARPHARTPARPHARTPARPHARTPARPHARTPARPHARTPARPHARTPARPPVFSWSEKNVCVLHYPLPHCALQALS